MKDAMGADSDWVVVQRKDIRDCKPGEPIQCKPYTEEKISIAKLMILAVFCFSVIYLIWR
jgi:hypothetical protein